MANIVLTDCSITIDGDDYSGQGTNVAISYAADAVETTAFGQGTRTNMGGLKTWSIEFEFITDEAATGADLFALIGTVVPVKVRPTSAVVSAGNPSYEGSALVTSFTPLAGAVGDLSKVSLSVVSAGTLTRAIA